MILRWYQTAAIDAVYQHLRDHRTNPCVVMPTGAGKSPTIAKIAQDAVEKWNGRVLCLAHRKELLEQNAQKLHLFAPGLGYGTYSAGLKKRNTDEDIIFAGIQSVYMKAELLGKFDLIIVDEAHLIPHEGDGMYRTFLDVATALNPDVRVIGFTATPYRMKTGLICSEVGILNEVVYDAPIVPLVNQGFLTKLVAKQGTEAGQIDTEGVKVTAGEFNASELEQRANLAPLIKVSVSEMMALTKDRKKVLIFCSGISHAESIETEILHYTSDVNTIFGETPPKDRDRRLEHFRNTKIKYLVNVGCFTEGLDVPDIDCIVLLRPTKSTGLYAQMVGRGFRVAEGKENCLILDYGNNVFRHGPIDEIRVTKNKRGDDEISTAPVKQCEQCQALVHTGFAECPECGWTFPEREVELEEKASSLDIMDRKNIIAWEDVEKIYYEDWAKRGFPDAPHTLRIDYRVSQILSISEWVCIGHPVGSFAWTKAQRWWNKRSHVDIPRTAQEAVDYIEMHGIREPGRIKVKYARNRKEFDRIEDYDFSVQIEKPPPVPDVEVPF